MGKRELLLIVAFVIVGAVVYQVTAPPPAPGERSFSLGRVIESIRREVRGNRASAEKTTTSTHPLDAGVTELRVVARGEITVTGEERGGHRRGAAGALQRVRRGRGAAAGRGDGAQDRPGRQPADGGP